MPRTPTARQLGSPMTSCSSALRRKRFVRRPNAGVILALAAPWGVGCGDGTGMPNLDPPPPEPEAPVPPALVADPVELGPTLHESDLTIFYIQRLPQIDYIWGSAAPDVQGWPAVGDEVTWRGHVNNWADTARSVDYAWLLDEDTVAAGSVEVPGHGEATIDFSWEWTFDRHLLSLVIDPADVVVEEDRNNRVDVFTDAISAGFYVERGFYEHFRANQHELQIGSNAFEDWAHRQIRMWNDMLAKARYSDSPDGVLDRVRLDRIHIVDDGALPLDPRPVPHGDFDPSQARPDVDDRTVDLQWGFPTRLVTDGLYADHTSRTLSNQFYYSGFLQHELGHARYLVDVYGWDVHHLTDGDRLEITEAGRGVVNTARMPASAVVRNGAEGFRVHATPEAGLMNWPWTFLDRYSAAAWNRIAGHRATVGNYNGPDNFGAFLNDLPDQNHVTLVDRRTEQRLAGATVRVYRSEAPAAAPDANAPYRHFFDDVADAEFVANERGEVALGRNPFSNGDIVHDAFTNGVIVVRVEHEMGVGYGFLESTAFNLAYWRGNRAEAHHVLWLDLF